MEGSVWARIPDRQDYAISGDGQIMRISATRKFEAGKLLKPTLLKIGYLMVSLCEAAKYKKRYLHRLVAKAFIPNPENKPEVNHKNGVKTNNGIENLEWATHKENMLHAGKTGLCKNGEARPDAKLTWTKVEAIRRLREQGRSYNHLARQFKVSARLISGICKGTRWSPAKS